MHASKPANVEAEERLRITKLSGGVRQFRDSTETAADPIDLLTPVVGPGQVMGPTDSCRKPPKQDKEPHSAGIEEKESELQNRKFWNEEETALLIEAVSKIGLNSWSEVKVYCQERSKDGVKYRGQSGQYKSRWETIMKFLEGNCGRSRGLTDELRVKAKKAKEKWATPRSAMETQRKRSRDDKPAHVEREDDVQQPSHSYPLIKKNKTEKKAESHQGVRATNSGFITPDTYVKTGGIDVLKRVVSTCVDEWYKHEEARMKELEKSLEEKDKQLQQKDKLIKELKKENNRLEGQFEVIRNCVNKK